MEKPKQLEVIEIDRIKKICQEYVDYIEIKEYHDDNDYRYYIYETVIESVFGTDFWKYLSEKDKEPF